MKALNFTAGTYAAENSEGATIKLPALKVEYEDVDPTENAIHIYAEVAGLSVLVSTDPDDEKFEATK
jgi:hypothetical protein